MRAPIRKPYVDVEFESDLQEVAECLTRLRHIPLSLPAHKNTCVAIRKAKLLLKSIGRDHFGRHLDATRLIQMAHEVQTIARTSQVKIPHPLQREFNHILSGLTRHASELDEWQAQP